MNLRPLFLLVGLSSVTGCTISDNEQLGLDEVEKMYGGKVSFKIGTVASTKSTDVQGKVLELDVTGADLAKYGDNLGLPASNSALVMYHHMSAAERADYNGLQVVLQSGTSGRKYNFRMPVLARADQAEGQLRIGYGRMANS
jgi:hypothetical protein